MSASGLPKNSAISWVFLPLRHIWRAMYQLIRPRFIDSPICIHWRTGRGEESCRYDLQVSEHALLIGNAALSYRGIFGVELNQDGITAKAICN